MDKDNGILWHRTMAECGVDPHALRRFQCCCSAADARQEWDYRKQKLTHKQARELAETLLTGTSAQRRFRKTKGLVSGDRLREYTSRCISDRIVQYQRRQLTRWDNRHRVEQAPLAIMRADADELLGGFNKGYRTRINCQDGLTLLLLRHEDVEWDRRGRKHWPTKRATTYTAILYSAKFDELKATEFNRRGDWVKRLCRQWSLKPQFLSKTALDKGKLPFGLTDLELVYDDKDWRVYHILTAQVASLLSSGTQWCVRHVETAGKYVERGLYICFFRGKRYALYCPYTYEYNDTDNAPLCGDRPWLPAVLAADTLTARHGR